MIEFLPFVLTGIGLTVSILYYSNALRNAQRTREMSLRAQKTQIFLQIYGTMNQERIERVNEIMVWEWTDTEDFQEKYGDRWSEVEAILQRYNGLGLLAQQDQVDLDHIYGLIILPVRGMWRKFKEIIAHRRELYEVPELYAGLEFLYHEIMKRSTSTG